jgi:glutamine synthetase
VQKNISIMASQLARAFSQGIGVDMTAVDGFFADDDGDIFLHPDPSTLAILPWRPAQGRVARFYCALRYGDGRPFPGDGRHLLNQSMGRASSLGYNFEIGFACDFYLFALDEYGQPTSIPHDQAGYCDIAPLDHGENVRRDICLALSDMGIGPESSHHQRGPGQHEITCKPSSLLEAADNIISFRSTAKIIAASHGLRVSFSPKPLPYKNGNGLHLHIYIYKGEADLLRHGIQEHNGEAEQFLAGMLRYLPELTAILNPSPESFARLGSDIPHALDWSSQNQGQPVRVPVSGGRYSRMELRSPDPGANPYFALALLVEAGLEGIAQKMPLLRTPEQRLPQTLDEAHALAWDSAFLRRLFPPQVLEQYCRSQPF